MTALDFLKSKGLIKDGFTELTIWGEFGQIELTKLLEEYKQEQLTSTDVKRERELLVAYEKHHYTPSEWALASKQCEKEIYDFLATNCG